MKSEDLEKITDSIIEKLGEDNSALILDDLTQIINANNTTLKTIENKDNEISKLKNRNEMLIDSNAKLYQQVGFNVEKDEPKQTENTKIDFKSFFDNNGRFK